MVLFRNSVGKQNAQRCSARQAVKVELKLENQMLQKQDGANDIKSRK
jgi:hypothetical protein